MKKILTYSGFVKIFFIEFDSVKRIDKIIKICGFIKNVLCEKYYVTWIYHHFFSTIFFLMNFFELKKLNFDSW